MTPKLTPQDVEQLSAYLDGQLPVREKMLLELRLRDDPVLQEELKALAQTHLALRSLPRRRAPRNFTLTPVMLPRRAGLRLFPAFRLASALAGVLLVLAFAGDLLLGGMGTSALPMAAAPAQVANQTEKMAAPENAAPLITWNSPTAGPSTGMGGAGYARGGGPANPTLAETEPEGMATQAAAVDQPVSPPEAAETATHSEGLLPLPTQAPQPTPTPSDLGLGSVTSGNPIATASETTTETPTLTATASVTPTDTPTPTPTATETETETVSPSSTATLVAPQAVGRADNNPILGVQPAYPPRQPFSQAPAAASQPQAAMQPHAIFRWLEWALGIALVAAGIAAFIFYRKEKI